MATTGEEFPRPMHRRAMSAMPAPKSPSLTQRVKSARRHSTFSARVDSNRPSVRVEARTYSTMKAAGPDPKDNYTRPKTGREGWWRRDIKETPHPHSYELPSFMTDVEEKNYTYRFLAAERQTALGPQGRSGEVLDPYLYHKKDFVDELDSRPQTYGFKVTERGQYPPIGDGFPDKHLVAAPNSYEVVNFLPEVPRHSTLSSFKSKTKRANPFPGKSGPGPASADLSKPMVGSFYTQRGTSSFLSGSRFKTGHALAPGPGTYSPMDPNPLPSSILAARRRAKSAPPGMHPRRAGTGRPMPKKEIREENGSDDDDGKDDK